MSRRIKNSTLNLDNSNCYILYKEYFKEKNDFTRLDIDSIRFTDIFFGIANQSLSNSALSSSGLVILHVTNFELIHDQIFSIGLRLGDLPGQEMQAKSVTKVLR